MIRSLVLFLALGVCGCHAAPRFHDDASSVVRVGTYETRAVAVAYAASGFNPVGHKMREYEEAKERGDERRAAELEAWGVKYQEHLHYLGFSRFPVDELLLPVQDGVRALAQRERLDVVAASTDHRSKRVDLVDVTDALVALYAPSERTLAMIRDLRTKPALPPEEVAHD